MYEKIEISVLHAVDCLLAGMITSIFNRAQRGSSIDLTRYVRFLVSFFCFSFSLIFPPAFPESRFQFAFFFLFFLFHRFSIHLLWNFFLLRILSQFDVDDAEMNVLESGYVQLFEYQRTSRHKRDRCLLFETTLLHRTTSFVDDLCDMIMI